MTLRRYWPAKLFCLAAAGALYFGVATAPTGWFVAAWALGASETKPRGPAVAQGATAGEETEVPPGQMKKYIAAYIAMQKNRSLTVEQAASRQGLTLNQFREIERRVERNDLLRERVRDALSEGAKERSKPAPTTGRPH